MVSKRYAPDTDQAIHRMISYHCLITHDILLPVCDSSWYVCQQISWQRLSQIHASPFKAIWPAS